MSKNTIQDIPTTNKLLGALPAEQFQRLIPKLEIIDFAYGEIIHEKKQDLEYVHFPNSGFISLNHHLADRHVLEVAMVGREGAFGLPVFFGVPTAVGRATVQGAGSATRIKAADFLDFCELGGVLPRILKFYTYKFIVEMTQSLVCNSFHRVEARLARWLLMARDRLEDDRFPITQHSISNMLGVRREAVIKSSGNLQRRKLINYHRGNVEIIDRAGLEAAACPCYALIQEEERQVYDLFSARR